VERMGVGIEVKIRLGEWMEGWSRVRPVSGRS
jgi:hypothetical protein